MARKLIITADDYGYTDLIDQAILGAARAGRITAVSAFANYAFNELKTKIKLLRDEVPNIPIGLHLSITSGSPLTHATSLMKKVKGKWQFKEPKEIVLKDIDLDEARTELVAQVVQMRQALNGKIDHLSCHHNILYLMPGLFSLLLEIAKDEGIQLRTPRNLISISKFSSVRELNPALIPLYIEHAFQAMNLENLKLALGAVGEKNVKNQEKEMKDQQITSPNYFLIHHYGNPDIEVFERTYGQIADQETCEQVMHLAIDKSAFDMKNFPNGINKKYLDGRNKEFVLLMSKENNDLINEVSALRDPIVLGSYST